MPRCSRAASVYQVYVLLAFGQQRPIADHAILSVKDYVLRVVGAEGWYSDAQVHDPAVFELAGESRSHLLSG